MSDAIAELYVEIGAKVDGLTAALKSVTDSLQKTKDEAATANDPFKNLWAQFSIGQIAADAVTKALGAVKDVIVDSIAEAVDYEKSLAGMANAFAVSGRDLPGVTSSLAEFASAMEDAGLASDDEILKAETLLLTLTNLDENGIKAATEGAVGLASVFGMSLQSATEAIAKGFEGNYQALGRLIPSIRDASTEGDKHAAMVQALAGFYKQAVANTDTYAGSVKKLDLAWKDAKQSLGDQILQTGILQAATKGASNILGILSANTKDLTRAQHEGYLAVQDFANSLQVLQPSMEEMRKAKEQGAKAWDEYKAATKRADDLLVANKDTINKWLDKGAAFLGLVKETPKPLNDVGGAAGGTSTNVQALADKIASVTTVINTALGPVRDINGLVETLGTTAYDSSNKLGTDLYNAIINIPTPEIDTKPISNNISEISSRWDDLMRDITQGWAEGIQGLVEGTTTFKDFLSTTWGNVKDVFFRFIADMIVKWITGLITPLVTSSATAAGTVGGAFTGMGAVIGGVATTIGGAISGLVGVVAAGIVTLATAVATAITTLAAAAPALLELGLVAAAIYTAFKLGESLVGAIGNLIGGGGDNSDITYWLKMIQQTIELGVGAIEGHVVQIKDQRFSEVKDKIDGLKGSVDLTRDTMVTWGKNIVSEISEWGGKIAEKVALVADAIAGTASYASGGVAWTPQLANVAETGPELIIPLTGDGAGGGMGGALAGLAGAGMGGGAGITVNIYAQRLDDRTITEAGEKLFAEMKRQQRRMGY